MANFQRHIGIIKNTGSRCVVVFDQLPDDKEFCVVVELDTLPPKYLDSLNDFIMTPEAQNEQKLSNLLARRQFPSGEMMLSALHTNGFMRKTPISLIDMLITRNQKMGLKEILGYVDDMKTGKTVEKSEIPEMVPPGEMSTAEKKTAVEQLLAQVNNIDVQVTALEAEKSELLMQAKKLNPSLRIKPHARKRVVKK